MANILILFTVVLIVLAAVVQADFIFIILYLFIGAYVLSHWWSRVALQSVKIERNYPTHAFFGEKIPVRVTASNQSRLPVVWAHLRETLPPALEADGVTQVVSYIPGKSKVDIHYELDCRQRGYYPIGPMTCFSGDLLGLSQQQKITSLPEHLTVYPKIIPLARIELPTNSPVGALRHRQPLLEDPARSRGKRDYVPGDALKRVDWKASAVAQRLVVRLFEPSIALETMIFLNFNRQEYHVKDLHRASELGVVAAASIANWVVKARQAVGLATNGIDPLIQGETPPAMLPRHGHGSLTRLLELLARVQSANTYPLVELIHRQSVHLSWGTSMIIIGNQASDDLFDTLFQSRRRGLNAILVLCGFVEDLYQIKRKAACSNFPIIHLLTEKDLDIWRD
jgi:uncharacterized protein (DUF58 family)